MSGDGAMFARMLVKHLENTSAGENPVMLRDESPERSVYAIDLLSPEAGPLLVIVVELDA